MNGNSANHALPTVVYPQLIFPFFAIHSEPFCVTYASFGDKGSHMMFQGPRDCQQLYDRGHRQSGVYAIFPDGVTKMDVYCEQELDGGGWMVSLHSGLH